MAEVHTEEGRLSRFVASERASTLAVAELPVQATRRSAAHFLRALLAAVPYQIHTVLTDHGTPCTALTPVRQGADQPAEVRHSEGLDLIMAYRCPVGAHWAIAGAHEAGLSVREVAVATGLSPSRVRQLLTSENAGELSVWLSRLRDLGLPPAARRSDELAGTCPQNGTSNA